MSNARAGFLHQSLLWKILAKSSKRRLCLLADWGVKVMVMSDMMVMSVMSNTMVTFDMTVMTLTVKTEMSVMMVMSDMMMMVMIIIIILAIIIAVSPPGTYRNCLANGLLQD